MLSEGSGSNLSYIFKAFGSESTHGTHGLVWDLCSVLIQFSKLHLGLFLIWAAQIETESCMDSYTELGYFHCQLSLPCHTLHTLVCRGPTQSFLLERPNFSSYESIYTCVPCCHSHGLPSFSSLWPLFQLSPDFFSSGLL